MAFVPLGSQPQSPEEKFGVFPAKRVVFVVDHEIYLSGESRVGDVPHGFDEMPGKSKWQSIWEHTMSHESHELGSVTKDLRDVQNGDLGDAAHDLVTRHYAQVIEKARRWSNRLQVVDADDVAVSVWDSILRGMAQGKYPCQDRREFEELLGKITYHKAVNLYNWVRRSVRHPSEKLENEKILEQYSLDERHRKVAELYYLNGRTETEICTDLGIEKQQVTGMLKQIRRWLQKYRYRPTNRAPQEFAMEAAMGDQPVDVLLFEELIHSLEGKLRETILWKLQGYSNQEIADRLDVTERQVQRRLKLVRNLLEAELRDE